MRFSLKNKLAHPSAFTITEVMVAMMIITMVLFSIISIFPTFFNYSYEFVQRTVAVNLAQTIMEESISKGYTLLTPGTTNLSSLSNYNSDFSGYSSSLLINYVDANLQTTATDSGLMRIQVNVSWTSKATGQAKTETLNTLLTKYQ